MSDKSSSFYSSLGLLVILNLVVKPVWIFGIDRQVQNIVGTETYGSYFALLNLSIAAGFILDLGLTTYYNRQLAAGGEKFMDQAGWFLKLKILLVLSYGAFIFLMAWISGVRDWKMLSLVAGIQAANSLLIYLRALVTARQWFRTDAWLSVLDKFIMIMVVGALIYIPATGGINLDKFLWVQLGATILACMICALFITQRGMKLVNRSVKGDLSKTFVNALPFGIIVLLMSVHYRLDGFLLERMHPEGDYEAGIYAGAYRLLDAANIIGFLFASFLLPFLANQTAKEKLADKVLLNCRHFLILISIIAVITLYFLAPWLNNLLYKEHSDYAVKILAWTMAVLPLYYLTHIYGTLLTARGHTEIFIGILFLSVLINISVNLLLIPADGAFGSCVAALVSQGFCAIMLMMYAGKKTQGHPHPQSLLMYIFIAALLFAFYLVCTRELAMSNWLLIILATLFTFILSLITGLWDRNIFKWISNKK